MTTLPVDRTVPVGEASGPTVVLIHGFASTAARDWPADRWAAPFAAAGRETIAVHLPAHGSGPAITSAEGGTTRHVLDQLAATVLTSAPGEVDVIGYSLGARLAWDLASGPVPVRRLVLGGLSPIEPFGAVDLVAARAFLAGGPAPADPLTTIIAGMCSADGQDGGSLLNLVEGMAREPFDSTAAPPAVPTLLVAGADDPMAQGIEGLAAHVAGARVARVPGDHLEALTGQEFRATAADFLGVDLSCA
jgi:pimeloyl-ACP methyl ester carboxylesterase